MPLSRILPLAIVALVTPSLDAQTTRPRLTEEKPAGVREKLSLGTLFVPEGVSASGKVPLFLHFHGPGWIAEVAAARAGDIAVLHAQLGSGSSVYGKPFQDPRRLRDLLAEAEKKAGREFELVGLTGWSAGYGAVRAILRVEEYYRQVQWVVLMDGLHAGYTADRKPVEADLDCYIRFAKDGAAGKKRFLVTHSAIVPGTYASTTEAADVLLAAISGKRRKIDGTFGLPAETEAQAGGLTILGCAGTTAPDHVDHLHALPALLTHGTRGHADAIVVEDVPLVQTTQLVPRGDLAPEAQVDAVFGQLAATLGRARSGLDRVVRLNLYVARDDVVPVIDSALVKRFPRTRKPAVTLVVGEPVEPGVLVSLDALARVEQNEGAGPGWKVQPAGPAYYISGQAERGKSLGESTRKTMAGLDATLKYLKCPREAVVHVKAFVHPMKQIAEVRKEIATYFSPVAMPPLTLLEWTAKHSIEIEMVVAAKASKEQPAGAIEFLTPPGMKASPIYTRVTRVNHGKRLYTSGIYGAGKDGAAEVKDAFSRLGAILKEHGSDYRHLAKATYYVSNDEASKQLNLLRPDYYDPKRPPAASKAPVRGVGRAGRGLALDMIALIPER